MLSGAITWVMAFLWNFWRRQWTKGFCGINGVSDGSKILETKLPVLECPFHCTVHLPGNTRRLFD